MVWAFPMLLCVLLYDQVAKHRVHTYCSPYLDMPKLLLSVIYMFWVFPMLSWVLLWKLLCAQYFLSCWSCFLDHGHVCPPNVNSILIPSTYGVIPFELGAFVPPKMHLYVYSIYGPFLWPIIVSRIQSCSFWLSSHLLHHVQILVHFPKSWYIGEVENIKV